MVELATIWFGLQPNENNKIFVEDGIVFIRGAKKRKEKYRSIILDVCYNEKQPRICPVVDFTKDSVIHDIAGILSEDGKKITD
ncbi:hypothetical protein KIN20_000555 [Parelaphostrongylus tenuis]|uniref:Uncharacterized protein n=1 Tax=Parelaphostrongylus tenuis TaxID=148309 RepID=A0AAD5MDG0_PARTN|nr:hypothetical protein KIN20_000555 [Parelaphostrongylus tenuis]